MATYSSHSFTSKPTIMLLRKWWVRIILILGIFTFLMLQYFDIFSSNELHVPTESCTWQEGDSQLFYLKTTSGVNYDGGHWFHVAENFMVQHSILRKSGNLANSSTVFFVTDRGMHSTSLTYHISSNDCYYIYHCGMQLASIQK